MSVVQEEIFGPVLVVATFDDDGIDEIVKEANNSIYGLAASVFTRDVSRAHKVAKELKAGTIGVNTHHVIDPALPFGGFNQSGWGREQGYEATTGGRQLGGRPVNEIPDIRRRLC
jgi:phenylacetaldehyde dehydrogenase